jgi:hypothetical protein
MTGQDGAEQGGQHERNLHAYHFANYIIYMIFELG